MKKRVLRELGKIFTHEKVESVEKPVENTAKPRKSRKKEE
jgi:hypothetical protein